MNASKTSSMERLFHAIDETERAANLFHAPVAPGAVLIGRVVALFDRLLLPARLERVMPLYLRD